MKTRVGNLALLLSLTANGALIGRAALQDATLGATYYPIKVERQNIYKADAICADEVNGTRFSKGTPWGPMRRIKDGQPGEVVPIGAMAQRVADGLGTFTAQCGGGGRLVVDYAKRIWCTDTDMSALPAPAPVEEEVP